jgi:hypothetical protein
MFLEGVLNSSKEYQKDIINEKIRTNRWKAIS